ncbi:MAG: FAD-dependent monooxygenase [Candidatus Eremiobacteraeota bacterium]|nr:FAD-dependent monooxygenase [Candidatus Eremiobacteraeota bacterium]
MEDVIIVGAGPSGLFLGIELARQGVKARILEQASQHHGQARGTALQPGTLEMLSRAGVLEPVLARAIHVHSVNVCGPGLVSLARTQLAGIDAAYEFECCEPQSLTEEVLFERLQQLGGEVELGIHVTALEDHPDHVCVHFVRADGETDSARARYVVGAGGSHSVVRSAMTAPHLEGETYAGHYLVADLRAELAVPPGESTVVVSPEGFALFAPLPEGRFLIFVNGPEGSGSPSHELLVSLLEQRVGLPLQIHDVRWSSYFRMHKRMAVKMGEGRRWLVGDAGHASSPLGGQGLNTALLDAADLGWKLGLVVRGQGRPSLLESYVLERHLSSQQVLDISDGIHQSVMGLVEASREGVLEPVAEPDAEIDLAASRHRAMLTIDYGESPLVGEWCSRPFPPGPTPGQRYPDRIRLQGPGHHLLVFGSASLHGFGERWGSLVEVVDAAGLDPARAGVGPEGLVLVRPDGYIGYRTGSNGEEDLRALEAHLRTYLELKEASLVVEPVP